jgi:outer membrane PBP1 activator LpoA protein
MRSLAIVLFSFILYGCTQAISQKPSEEAAKEAEFQKLLQEAKKTKETNRLALELADKRTTEVIKETKVKIVKLEEEVVELKDELHEALTKSDTIDLDIKFKLLPISVPENKTNRK